MTLISFDMAPPRNAFSRVNDTTVSAKFRRPERRLQRQSQSDDRRLQRTVFMSRSEHPPGPENPLMPQE